MGDEAVVGRSSIVVVSESPGGADDIDLGEPLTDGHGGFLRRVCGSSPRATWLGQGCIKKCLEETGRSRAAKDVVCQQRVLWNKSPHLVGAAGEWLRGTEKVGKPYSRHEKKHFLVIVGKILLF